MTPQSNTLDRREVVARLLRDRGDTIVVTSLGSPTYDVAAAGDHDRNFYLWGAMGGAAMVGLGLAIAQPDIPVVVIAGDGEMLMGLGSLATVALQKPGNLTIVVLDNELYGETGGQMSHTGSCADLTSIANGCGIADAHTVTSQAELEDLARRLNSVGSAPTVAVVKVDGEDQIRCLPSRDGVFLKGRLRGVLGLETM